MCGTWATTWLETWMADPPPTEPTGWLVGYARVSTDDQNLDLQIDALTKYGVPRENIHEDMASGATADRPGFIAMFKDLRPGDTLVIWKLDRLGRDLSQLMQTADKLRLKQARLVILQESIDTGTPMGRFMFGVMGAFAQLEREMMTRDALADLRAEIHLWSGDDSSPVDLDVLRRAADEIKRLRAEAMKFEVAWTAVSEKYEALLLQLGATDA